MLKTYRIIPSVFILFLFGFTLITVAPVNAQTVDQLIERIEKLEAFHADDTATPSLTQPSSPDTPVLPEPHAKVTDGPWDPSMGMCHNSRPCMKSNMCGKMCDASVRASKGWVRPTVTNTPGSQGTPPSGEVCSVRDCSPSSDVAALRLRSYYMQIACEKCTNHKHEGEPPYNIWTCDLPPDTKLKCY